MKQDFNLIAEIREDQGKGASRRLRLQGKVPAILYGAGRPPRLLSFDQNKVLQQLEHEAFYSSILNVKVGDNVQPVIVKDIQRHPARTQILHMDFQRIVADQKIRMNVPIHFVGEEIAVGVKTGGGKVSHLMTDVEVSCLPKDLPEYFEVDVSALDVDDMLYLSDIKVPEGVEIIELTHGEEHDQPIVSIHVIKEQVIEEPEAVAEEPAEGEAPAATADAKSEGKPDED
ncbi:MAG: 50S ribosomal protein L25/general stress protein Ctc [Gammaproteobacteria bacterium]|nr:50S ribosomal protein L25/general stress protein Ctc [Gammaproteobacteria bacterium]MDH4314312.1 50S ribosomal protein L25/general stress protein Ctc [Gammaproteobacteria bacterium]MDH5215868.1 50S ribosomal protein L25/general stress protein Ctc [Gammaproteobacteria bacterium]MDH5499890.1 50S ribosomal protein L25/general stress protein Ctc [Gammaproteobacteria bacterium]